jgi:uncharacterized protein (DUF983 family)
MVVPVQLHLLVGQQLTTREISSLAAAIGRRCPACGRGKLYASYLKVAARCLVCDISLGDHDSGDGPAFFVILPVGIIVVGLAFWFEATFAPPYWLRLVIWLPVTLALSLVLLPPLKAWLIAQHYRHNLPSDRLVGNDEP